MIRWSYVIPRLVLLGTLAVLLWVGLNPLVRWAIISTGQSATSAKVEIGRVQTSLLRTELRLTDVRVANPNAPMENLLQADQVTLALDADSLLRRKLVVREGRVSGLRFATDRETSGELDPAAAWHLKLPRAELAELGEKWLDQTAEILKRELRQQAEQLHSVRLARELVERWPAEYDRLTARADSLKWRIDNLRALAEVGGNGPLAALDVYQRAASELQEIQREVAELRSEIDRLRRQVLLDKDAIVLAKEQDLRQIRETFRIENLNAESLSEYLLGPELSETVQTLAEWVDWGRQYLPTKVDRLGPVRGRGVDVLFPGVRQRPDFVIQSLVLDGEGRLGRRRFQFLGTAADVASQPGLYGRPVVLKAQINAETTLAVEAVLDHTGETPHERITINCPGLKQPERVLGRPGQLAVSVSPGSTHLWVSLDLEGEALSGQILLKQEPVELVPDLAAAYGGQRLAGSLQAAMSELREIRAVVDLSGTLKKPEWEFRSNLGPQLAAALNGLLQRELEARREELLAHVRGQVEGELARFDQKVLAKQEALFGKLDLGGMQIQELNQVIAQRIRLPDSVRGAGLPEGLPFRF